MEFVDKALARRLEAAEEMPQVHYALAYQKLRPEVGAAVEKICGGHMIFAGLGSPIGRATGLGLDRPFTREDIGRVEAFYHSHHAPAQVDICPLHDPELLEVFKQRGYALAELNNVLWRRLRTGEGPPPAPPGVYIRRGGPEEADTFAAIVARCFAEYGVPPEGFETMLMPNYQFPGSISFVASVEGQAVGVGAGLVIPEHKVLALFGAGTLPEFRGRGIQTALLGFRLQLAAQAGCDLAVIVTRGGTTSQRNAERLGFRLAYSKATVVKKIL
ncbi:MAG: GNAT family N-acetyltransferase [Acidobacteriia bacterium]|nr:GNAT family N-acetyltransferase [Terriglobia bacterium]